MVVAAAPYAGSTNELAIGSVVRVAVATAAATVFLAADGILYVADSEATAFER